VQLFSNATYMGTPEEKCSVKTIAFSMADISRLAQPYCSDEPMQS
jgi:hypothetical protein